jgi:hypothetical protein
MKALVETNIRKAVDKLNSINASLDFQLCGLHPRPVFYGQKQNIISAQSDFFGFYVLANAIRSMLRGINFIVASQCVLESKLLAPSVALSYTAGFHGLMAHLALEGRPFFEDGCFAWAEKRSDGTLAVVKPPTDLPFIAAVLRENNTWSFECRKRSHKTCWRELLHLFDKDSYTIPQYYYALFEYLFRGRQKEQKLGVEPLKERIENPALCEANKLRLEDAKEEFLDRIAEIRHRALYGAFGEDPGVVEAMWNNDVTSSLGIERQTNEFYSFSKAMLDHVSSDIVELLSVLNLIVSVRKALCVCVYVQWFDTPLPDDMHSKFLASRIRWIERWLNAGLRSENG